jgi:hypothetical protein
VVLEAMAREAKILSTDAPQTSAPTDPTGATPYDLKGLSLDELQALAERLAEKIGAARRRPV